jgi:hypothetical protein
MNAKHYIKYNVFFYHAIERYTTAAGNRKRAPVIANVWAIA